MHFFCYLSVIDLMFDSLFQVHRVFRKISKWQTGAMLHSSKQHLSVPVIPKTSHSINCGLLFQNGLSGTGNPLFLRFNRQQDSAPATFEMFPQTSHSISVCDGTMVPRRKLIATSIMYFPQLDLIFLLINAQTNQERSLEHLICIEIVHRFKFK